MITDDRLRLVFTCCHPALAREAQVALTLRLVCGLTTAEIARAFLVPEPTMAARVTRAKKKISAARIPYRVPGRGRAARPPRRGADRGPPALHDRAHRARRDPTWSAPTWSERAIGLARMLRELMPDERRGARAARAAAADRRAPGGAAGARRPAAAAGGAGPVAVGPGRDRRGHRPGHRGAARQAGRPGRFVLQAAIAAVHAEAPSYAETDWPQLLASTTSCCAPGRRRWWRSTARWCGPWWTGRRPGWRISRTSRADGQLAGYRYLPAAKADLLRRLGRARGRARGLPRRAGADRERGRAGVPGPPDRRGVRHVRGSANAGPRADAGRGSG